jgi:hypothetical protein
MDEYYGGTGVMGAYAGPTDDWWNLSGGTDILRTNIATTKVIQSGLVLNLDAGVSSSYPGSGTTWTDLSGSGNNGTLQNGPTFNSANGGSIVFNGINDYIQASESNIFNNFSYDIWCLPETTHQIESESTNATGGTSGQRYVIGPQFVASPDAGSGISVGTNGISVYEHSAGYMPPLLVHSVTINSPAHIVVNYTSKVPSLYLNGSFIKNGLTSPRTNVKMCTDRIGNDGSSYGFFLGKIYSTKFYNRALTATEITQNFNATRSRFGI